MAVLPWAIVLTFGLPSGAPLMQQTIALAASLLLLVSLPGRAMFERYEGKATMDWSGPRMGLVRWTIILNIASALGLFLFVVLYRYTIEWHLAIPAFCFSGSWSECCSWASKRPSASSSSLTSLSALGGILLFISAGFKPF